MTFPPKTGPVAISVPVDKRRTIRDSMKVRRYTEEQNIAVLKEGEAGAKVGGMNP